MTAADLVANILLLGPGFLMLKIAAVAGAQHRRLEWEWIVWSVLASIPLASVALGLRVALETAAPHISVAEVVTGAGYTWAAAAEVVIRFVAAVAAGLAVGRLWGRVRHSADPRLVRLKRSIEDSAWDLVLDDATRVGKDGNPLFGIEVTVLQDGKEVSYYGKLSAFGYERAEAEPWLYLREVQRWEGPKKGYQPLSTRTHGMLFHRERVARLRVINST